MIHVIAFIKVKPGTRDGFVEAFKKLVPTVLAEKGCLAYGPTLDVPTGLPIQSEIDAQMVTIVEQWQSVETLKAHLDAPHMHAFRAANGHMIDSITLRVTQPA